MCHWKLKKGSGYYNTQIWVINIMQIFFNCMLPYYSLGKMTLYIKQ